MKQTILSVWNEEKPSEKNITATCWEIVKNIKISLKMMHDFSSVW